MIKVRFFAAIKERIGNEEIPLNLAEGCVADIVQALKKDIPEIEEVLKNFKVMIAVNHEMADMQTALKDGDEVAFIPPFSGGAPHPAKELVTQGFSLETKSNA